MKTKLWQLLVGVLLAAAGTVVLSTPGAPVRVGVILIAVGVGLAIVASW